MTLALPPKKIELVETHLSDDQFEIYRDIARRAKAGGRGAMLAAIGKLIRLCAHPTSVLGSSSGDVMTISCPKLDVTLDIISKIKSRSEKVIIFTDFKKIQRVLQESIRNKIGTWADIINGEINRNRQQIIDIFSEKQGFNIIILGHQVAGVGLNISAANHVIHYTRPWNPAKENQATDRAHRIGQKKEVNVYYPIVKDDRFVTVEQRLAELIQSKSDLARDVLRPSAEFKLKPEDLIDCIDDPNL
jgi:SNF2 family DNA or RNA helicase